MQSFYKKPSMCFNLLRKNRKKTKMRDQKNLCNKLFLICKLQFHFSLAWKYQVQFVCWCCMQKLDIIHPHREQNWKMKIVGNLHISSSDTLNQKNK
jgi:hypothetical protein